MPFLLVSLGLALNYFNLLYKTHYFKSVSIARLLTTFLKCEKGVFYYRIRLLIATALIFFDYLRQVSRGCNPLASTPYSCATGTTSPSGRNGLLALPNTPTTPSTVNAPLTSHFNHSKKDGESPIESSNVRQLKAK